MSVICQRLLGLGKCGIYWSAFVYIFVFVWGIGLGSHAQSSASVQNTRAVPIPWISVHCFGHSRLFSFLFYCWWWLCGGWFQSVCRPVICLLFWGGRNYNKITGSKKFETYMSNYYYFLHTRLILSSYFLGLLNVQDVLFFFFLTIPSV